MLWLQWRDKGNVQKLGYIREILVTITMYYSRITKKRSDLSRLKSACMHTRALKIMGSSPLVFFSLGLPKRGINNTHTISKSRFSCEKYGCVFHHQTLCVLYVVVNLINVKKTSIAVAIAPTILSCVRINVQVRKQNMLEHVVKGIRKTVLYIIKMGCILPTTMDRDLHSENWFDIYVNYHHRHRGPDLSFRHEIYNWCDNDFLVPNCSNAQNQQNIHY